MFHRAVQLGKGLRVRACIAAEQHQTQNKVPHSLFFLLLYHNFFCVKFPLVCYVLYTPWLIIFHYMREGSKGTPKYSVVQAVGIISNIIISTGTFGPLSELCITFGYEIVVRHGLCSLLCLVSQ